MIGTVGELRTEVAGLKSVVQDLKERALTDDGSKNDGVDSVTKPGCGRAPHAPHACAVGVVDGWMT